MGPRGGVLIASEATEVWDAGFRAAASLAEYRPSQCLPHTLSALINKGKVQHSRSEQLICSTNPRAQGELSVAGKMLLNFPKFLFHHL